MEKIYKLLLIVTLSISFVIFILSALLCVCRRKRSRKDKFWDKEACVASNQKGAEQMEINGELIRFKGGEDLTSIDILDAPGEVIGRSSYGTLYRANLATSDSVVCLRFLRPTCTKDVQDLIHLVELLGSIRHPNLVPLYGFYSGTRGEKLLVHPFYGSRNLAQFIEADERVECQKWAVISTISKGIARGLDYLHTGLQNPIIHGNLKSKNVFLDQNLQPLVSDFGLHAFLNPNAAQEMLELSKIEDTSEATDIYNFGLILLELVTGKEPVSNIAQADQDLYHPKIMFDDSNGDGGLINEERVLGFVRLAMECCSPSPSLRPNIKQICRKLEEI